MINITICPSCGSKKIGKTKRDWTGELHGQFYSVPLLEFYECPDCGEKIYDRHAMRKIEAYSPAYNKTKIKAAA
jgi:YgiT-type zinc finger domain-containing protein